MNKLIASTGCLALLGAVTAQAASIYAPAPELTSKDKAKPWSVAATVRGFYDDNVLNSYEGVLPGGFRSQEIDTFGIEVGPTVGLHMAMEQTFLSIDYGYQYVWYAENDLEDDQRHRVNFDLRHSFTERFKISLKDSFVKTNEPEVIDSGQLITGITARRSDASMLRNFGIVDSSYEFTDLFSMGLAYENHYYDYSDPLYESLLNRQENVIRVDGRWKALPDLTALLGYQYSHVDYYGDGTIPGSGGLDPDTKNREEHYVFVGVDYTMIENLVASVRVGGQYTKYPNVPAGGDDDQITPYADARATYTYNQGSHVVLGVNHRVATTDVALTLDAETTTVYGNWKHMITPKLYGRADFQAQFGEFNEGNFDGDNEDLYMAGLGLGYQINEFWSTDLSYRYTELNSDVAYRDFDRNRVYLGVTASY